MDAKRIEHLEKEVKCVRILVKGIYVLLSHIVAKEAKSRSHHDMLCDTIAKYEKQAQEVFE